jgi:hypothetical protein
MDTYVDIEVDDNSEDSFTVNEDDDFSKCKNLIRVIDNDRHVIKRRINRKTEKIVVYTTKYTPGSPIRNAVSGHYQTGMTVGNKEELNFFKVSLSVYLGQNPTSKHLYYDSPSQYERHFSATIDDEIKEKWKARWIS